jgi:hypothetical protein
VLHCEIKNLKINKLGYNFWNYHSFLIREFVALKIENQMQKNALDDYYLKRDSLIFILCKE